MWRRSLEQLCHWTWFDWLLLFVILILFDISNTNANTISTNSNSLIKFFASSVLLYLYCAPLYTQQYKQFFTKQFSCQLGEPSNIFDNLEKYILKFWQKHFICQLRSPQWVRVRTLNSCVISRLCQVSSRNSILTNTFRQFEQIYLTVWKNIFENFTICISNFDKYIWKFEQIYLIIWTNIFDNLNKYIWQFEQIYMTIWTNIFDRLDKYISNFGKYSESEVLNSAVISSLCQVRFPKEIQHLFKLFKQPHNL